jgi:soluble lytic murein transglycosylase-like protein
VYPDPALVSQADAAADQYGVPQEIFRNLINAESSWNPNATTPAGNGRTAEGITQIIPQYHPGVDPYNPSEALPYTAKTLSEYYSQFGSWESAVAAWNAGPNAVQKYGGVPPYGETQNYVRKIFTGINPVTTGTLPLASSEPAPGDTTSGGSLVKWIVYVVAALLLFAGYKYVTR